ncbi:penicillin acylase family protein [Kribbella sp. VKM Ac-2568]|uniref:penicillin acylase family protein n=1 Tax=Kribbella sp. VKM Ac-2568 TaxID=2512219 RepID=UPI00104A72AD|nr:penicillin acylase family protein [Kribbella sp. VKM Ac-2568]TCM46968.1 F5/8 type C domain-containing protein [Kribbella sp. VKM Ac-2568]
MTRRRPAQLTRAVRTTTAALAVSAVLAAGLSTTSQAGPAAAAVPVDYCVGQCADIVPPGQNGNATFTDLLLFKGFGTRPPHFSDTVKPYERLVWNSQGITDDGLDAYFDDASFGVRPGDVASTIHPRADVTIVRDKSRGVPHITGTTHEGTMFGAGYAGAQDRLFVMDVFRHLGRGQLTPFAGGAAGNRAFEQEFWRTAPYTEAELQKQFDDADERYGANGVKMQKDIQAWVDGVNHYIDTVGIAYPGEYVALGLPTPQPWKVTDVVATAAVVAGIFGTGGGGEMESALALLEAQAKYGVAQGTKVWESFRSQNDPEANTTVHNGATFPYGTTPANPAGRAIPDRGSVTPEPEVVDQTGSAGLAKALKPKSSKGIKPPNKAQGKESLKGIFDGGVFPEGFGPKGMSNALLVSGAHTESGNPVAVYGPQTSYFAPQLLLRQELQGPGVSSRGVAFAGLNFYTLIGRGADYSWSATSAGQDITDTYAVELCEPGGGTPTKNSTHYLFRHQCVPIEKLERHNAWYPSLGSSEPAGSYTLVAQRTKFGIVTHRGTVGGKPVLFTKNRSTYGNEAGSALGFMLFNDPDAIHSAQDFQNAATNIGYTFNWFYTDKTDIAYFNSGDNPVRPAGADPNLPTWSTYEWQGWNPETNRATYTPPAQHPQVVNQDYLTSWNNKQAPGFSAADGNFGYNSVYRSQPLDDRIKAVIGSGQKFSRGKLVEAMEDAATVDLRADQVLPYLLRVLKSELITDPAVAAAVARLEAWQAAGSHRKTANEATKTYDHAEAIRILDAWWPLLVPAQFQGLGPDLYGALVSAQKIDERPSAQGSAFQNGWWGFVQRDLRKVLGDPVKTPQPVTYCGGGSLAACRTVLAFSLLAATKVPAATTYPATADCTAGDQYCADQIVHQPMGGITQGRMTWVNRPTYQQVVEFPARRGDDVSNQAVGKTATASSYETGLFNSPPAKAVDGDLGTRWASKWSDPQWLKVDLGAEQTIRRVVLRWEAAYGSAYRIEVSRDNVNWQQVFATGNGDGGEDVARFAATTARYVRITGTRRATSYGYSLYEFQVYRQ